MAQSVARQAVNLQVAGSNPAGGDTFAASGDNKHAEAALAQLGERQTEDLKVPGSIPGGGTLQHRRRTQVVTGLAC